VGLKTFDGAKERKYRPPGLREKKRVYVTLRLEEIQQKKKKHSPVRQLANGYPPNP
jgi:hypothetical protein